MSWVVGVIKMMRILMNGPQSNLDGDFPKDSIFAGWTQAQYDAYQEEPRKYEKYLGGGSFELS